MEGAQAQKTILNSLAYYWSAAERAVIQVPGSSGFDHPSAAINGGTDSLGRLALLPLEILHNILRELDFESLGSLRCLNTQSKVVVETLPAYRDLATFAHRTLRVLSATRLLSRYSAKRLYSVLCQDRCFGCNGFGSFLFLPTASRCCYSCIESNQETDIVTISAAAALFGLAHEALGQISIITTVPGDYGIPPETHCPSIQVVSRQEARMIGILFYGSEDNMNRAVTFGDREGGSRRRQSEGPPEYTDRSIPWHPVGYRTLRYMACTPFPYLDVQRRRIEKGLWCRGCEYNWYRRYADFPPGPRRPRIRRELCRKQKKILSEDEFLVHFENCSSAKMLWTEYILKDKELSESASNTTFRT